MDKIEKKEVRVEISYYISLDDFTGSLDKITDFIKTLPNKVKEHCNPKEENPYFNAIYRYEIEREINYEDEAFNLVGYRLETDKEFLERKVKNEKARIEAENKRRKNQEVQDKKDLEEFERLKKKYGTK